MRVVSLLVLTSGCAWITEEYACVEDGGTFRDGECSYPDPSLFSDDDGDGYCEHDTECDGGALPGDCDDVDPEVNPGEREKCDGKINDCATETEAGMVSRQSETGQWYDVDSIQEALSDVEDGDRITVCAGTWNVDELTVGVHTFSLEGIGGREAVILDGGANGTVLTIGGGGMPGAEVTVSGLTIQNGAAIAGGGIQASGVQLVLDDVRVQNNTATTGAGLSVDGPLELVDSIVSDNVATGDGGGLYVFSSRLTMDGSTVSGNTAARGAGAMLVACVLVGDADTIIEENEATGDGGGVYFDVGDALPPNLLHYELSGPTVRNNIAGGQGGGLAIHVDDQVVYAQDLRLQDNDAVTGGGLALVGSTGELVLQGVDLIGNAATNGGGLSAEGGQTSWWSPNGGGGTATGDGDAWFGSTTDAALHVCTDAMLNGEVAWTTGTGVQTASNLADCQSVDGASDTVQAACACSDPLP